MIGRNQDIVQATEYVNRSKNGKPGVLLINGPAGIGKTTMVSHLANLYKDACIIHTRIIDSVSLPYGPYVSAVRTIFQDFPDIKEELKLSDHLNPLLPEMNKEPDHASPQAMVEAVREVFQSAAKKKFLIFIIEDLHWADSATLEMIPQHLDGVTTVPIAVIGTYRNEGLPHDHKLKWLRTELRRSGVLCEISLNPFSNQELSDLLREELQAKPDPGFVNVVFQKTAGNPLFALELVKTLQEQNLLDRTGEIVSIKGNDVPIPDSIQDLVTLQTGDLSQPIKDVLEIAATMGEEFDLEILNKLAEQPDVIDELLKTQLVTDTRTGKGVFKHTLFREAVRHNIPWSRRKQINQRIADTLKQLNAEPETVGDFYMQAGNQQEAVTAFSNAARKYCSIFAYKDAAAAARKALDNWPVQEREQERLELLFQLAQCARLSGQLHDSIMALRELSECETNKNNPQELGEIQRDLATCYALQGSWSSYKSARKQAALEFEKAGLVHEAAKEWCALANQQIDELNLAAAIDAVNKALSHLNENSNNDLKSRALGIKGYALSMQGNTTEGHELGREAISLALNENNSESVAYAYRKLAGTYEYASDFDQSLQVYDTALNFCYKENLNVQAQFCLSCMSWVLFRLGDWKRGLEVSYEVINDPQTNNASKATANIVIGIIRSYRGEFKQAKNHLDQGLMLSQKENFKLITLVTDWAYAAYHELNGDKKESEQRYRDLIVHWEEFNDLHDVLPGLVAASAFYAGTEKELSLTRCIKILSEVCDATGNPEAVGSLAYALGVRSLMLGELSEASIQFGQAIRQFDEIKTPLQLIATRKGMAEVLIAQSKTDQAIDELRIALKDAKNLGLRPWAGELTVLLEKLGATLTESRDDSHPTRINQAGLTRRQVEVIEEMSRGLSNKEIASKLHLSTRTVDMHVSNILSRLNCRSRTEAVKIALAEDLIE